MRGQKHYSDDKIYRVIDEYFNGKKLKIVCDRFRHTHRRTITRGALRRSQNIAKKRPGPDPVMSFEMESDLVDWVVGMHSQRYPVTLDMIFLKGNEIYWGFCGLTGSVGYLKRGWLNLFMNQHPLLTLEPLKRSIVCGLRQHKKVYKY